MVQPKGKSMKSSRVGIYKGQCGNAEEIFTLSDHYGNDFGRASSVKEDFAVTQLEPFGETKIYTYEWYRPLLMVNGEFSICFCQEEENNHNRCHKTGKDRMDDFNIQIGTLTIEGREV